jgi:flagellar biosynthesis protein FlhA
MNGELTLRNMFTGGNLRQLGAPLLIIMILAMMVLPLPPVLLDLFFTFNIALAVMVLLVSMYTKKPLDFSIFPTVLLVTTLLRLSLNVASTRVVLLEGHTGGDAAGKVIEAFGHFLVGGNYAVGLVVFVILVVINFVVITKGAGRIAEVSARFTLDAMPGKQMAIDADLNAGLIGEDVARKRRTEIAQEADFFGSMDGASKFVRGDAIAGILILFINILGGLIVGVVQHDMELARAAQNYTLLTIGDGLVAQIPALIISTAAGLVVSRGGHRRGHRPAVRRPGLLQPAGADAHFRHPRHPRPDPRHAALRLPAVRRRRRRAGVLDGAEAGPAGRGKPAAPAAAAPMESQEASWADVAPVDVLGLEVGYRLIPLVDKRPGRRAAQAHPRPAQEVRPGSRLPGRAGAHPRQPRTEAERLPHRAEGRRCRRGRGLAGHVPGHQPGPRGRRLARHADARIRPSACRRCGSRPACATRRTPSATRWWTPARWSPPISTTSSSAMPRNCSAGRRPRRCSTTSPRTRRRPSRIWCRSRCRWRSCSACCRTCWRRASPCATCARIIETVAEHAPRTQDPLELTAQVRVALGRSIVQQLYPGNAELSVMALDPVAGARAAAGGADRRPRRQRHRAGPGRHAAQADRRRRAAPGGDRPAGGDAGAGAAALAAVALPAPRRAATESHRQRRGAGRAHHQSHLDHRR